jgi:hypothetical protein
VFGVCLLGALMLAPAAAGQPEKEPPYQVPTPAGWGKETIALPPAFAPDMKWKGTEELRFAPGMFKAGAPDFFSYALLFWLPDDADTDAKAMEGKKQKLDTKAFTLILTALKKQPARRPGGEPVAGYVGELKWIEPFATGKPQTLRLEIHSWPSAKHKHRCVFVCASPQPETAAVWKALRAIRAGCTFR